MFKRRKFGEIPIKGDTLPVVICELDEGEKLLLKVADGMDVTKYENGKQLVVALENVWQSLSGDTVFQNIYTAEHTNGMISIASCLCQLVFEISINEIILQKSAFLASEHQLNFQCILEKLGSGYLVRIVLLCKTFRQRYSFCRV